MAALHLGEPVPVPVLTSQNAVRKLCCFTCYPLSNYSSLKKMAEERKRKPNWSEEEKMVLLKEYDKTHIKK